MNIYKGIAQAHVEYSDVEQHLELLGVGESKEEVERHFQRALDVLFDDTDDEVEIIGIIQLTHGLRSTSISRTYNLFNRYE